MIFQTLVVDSKLVIRILGPAGLPPVCEYDKAIGWEFETLECYKLYSIHVKSRRGGYIQSTCHEQSYAVWSHACCHMHGEQCVGGKSKKLVQEATATIPVKVQFAQHLWRLVPGPPSWGMLVIYWVIQGVEETTRQQFDDELKTKAQKSWKDVTGG